MPELVYFRPKVIYDVRGEQAINEDDGVIISRKAAVEAYRAMRAISGTEEQADRRKEPDEAVSTAWNQFVRAVDPDLYED